MGTPFQEVGLLSSWLKKCLIYFICCTQAASTLEAARIEILRRVTCEFSLVSRLNCEFVLRVTKRSTVL